LEAQSGYEDFVCEESEKLLRYVEYRRQDSLGNYAVNLDSQQIFNEKVNISIFFSHHALRCRDLRFLNAVFKLNYWLMGVFWKNRSDTVRVRYLVSLAEQENTAKELIK
jgi:hypothetical protein